MMEPHPKGTSSRMFSCFRFSLAYFPGLSTEMDFDCGVLHLRRQL